jgi:hypothetical protein
VLLSLFLASCSSPSDSGSNDSQKNQKVAVTAESFKQILKTQKCDYSLMKISELVNDISGDRTSDGIAFYACPASAGRSRQFGYFAIGSTQRPDFYEVPFDMTKLSFVSMKITGPEQVRFVFDSWSDYAPECCSDQKETFDVSFTTGWPVVIRDRISY